MVKKLLLFTTLDAFCKHFGSHLDHEVQSASLSSAINEKLREKKSSEVTQTGRGNNKIGFDKIF